MGHDELKKQLLSLQQSLMIQLNVIIGQRALINYAPLNQLTRVLLKTAHAHKRDIKEKNALYQTIQAEMSKAYVLTEAECVRINTIIACYDTLAYLTTLTRLIDFSSHEPVAQRLVEKLKTLYTDMRNVLFFTDKHQAHILSDSDIHPLFAVLSECTRILVQLHSPLAVKEHYAPMTPEVRITMPPRILAPQTPLSMPMQLYKKLESLLLSNQALFFWSQQVLAGGKTIKHHDQSFTVPTYIAELITEFNHHQKNPADLNVEKALDTIEKIMERASAQKGFFGLFGKPLMRSTATEKFYRDVMFALSDDFIVEHQFKALDATLNEMNKSPKQSDKDRLALRYSIHR